MSNIESVEQLEVFKLAHNLCLRIYELTSSFPKQEQFGLSAQMRKASSSIPANLAEGAGRLSSKEYRQFVGIARGSAAEINYHLLLCRDLSLVPEVIYGELREGYAVVNRMLTKLARSLRDK